MNKYKGKEKNELNSLINLSLSIYMVSLFFFNGTTIFYVASALFVITYLIKLLSVMRLRLGTVGIIMSLFILYNFFIILGGNVYFLSGSIERLIVLILNLVIHIFIMNHLISSSNRFFFIRHYIFMSIAISLFLIIADYDNLINARLGFNLSYPFGINGIYNPNIIGLMLCIAILFCLLLYHQSKNKQYVALTLFFLLIILMLGSRKALIFGVSIIALVPVLNSRNIILMSKKILGSLMLIIIIFFIITNMPFLDDLIGARTVDVLNAYLTGEEFTESSAFHRNQMILIAKELIAEKPFLGYGLDSFTLFSPYSTYAHNNYYELWVGAGFIGVVLYYLSYTLIFFKLLKNLKLRNMENTIYIVFVLMMFFMDIALVSYVSREITFMFFLANAFIIDQKQSTNNFQDRLSRLVSNNVRKNHQNSSCG